MLQNSFSLKWYILDSNGNQRSASLIPVQLSPDTIILFFIDNSPSSYNAVAVVETVTVGSSTYTILYYPVSATKQSYTELIIPVFIKISNTNVPDFIVNDVLQAFGNLFTNLTVTFTYQITTYQTGGSPPTCLNTASSQSTNSVTLGVSSVSASSVTLAASISLGSCQQLTPIVFTFRDGRGNNVAVSPKSLGYNPSPVCGYGQSCTYPVRIIITL